MYTQILKFEIFVVKWSKSTFLRLDTSFWAKTFALLAISRILKIQEYKLVFFRKTSNFLEKIANLNLFFFGWRNEI
jgi:hypothetical protein